MSFIAPPSAPTQKGQGIVYSGEDFEWSGFSRVIKQTLSWDTPGIEEGVDLWTPGEDDLLMFVGARVSETWNGHNILQSNSQSVDDPAYPGATDGPWLYLSTFQGEVLKWPQGGYSSALMMMWLDPSGGTWASTPRSYGPDDLPLASSANFNGPLCTRMSPDAPLKACISLTGLPAAAPAYAILSFQDVPVVIANNVFSGTNGEQSTSAIGFATPGQGQNEATYYEMTPGTYTLEELQAVMAAALPIGGGPALGTLIDFLPPGPTGQTWTGSEWVQHYGFNVVLKEPVGKVANRVNVDGLPGYSMEPPVAEDIFDIHNCEFGFGGGLDWGPSGATQGAVDIYLEVASPATL